MADCDIICLSSDDEVTHDVSPPKRAKVNFAPLSAKIEPNDNKKTTIVCSLKRKSVDDNGKSVGGTMKKKQKVDDSSIEEIIIESADVTKPSTTIRTNSNVLSVDVLRDKLANGTILINKVTDKKPNDLPKSINDNGESSNSKAKVANVKNNANKRSSDCPKQINGKNAVSSKLHTSKSNLDISDKLLNPVAKLQPAMVRKTSCSEILQSNERLVDGTNKTEGIGQNNLSNVRISRIETLKSPLLSSKSKDVKISNCAKPENIVDGDENSKSKRKINHHEKSENCAISSLSPEIVIIPKTIAPKTSIRAKRLFSNSTSEALNSESKNLPNTQNTTNGPEKSPVNGKVLNNECDNILTKNNESTMKRIKPQRLLESTSYQSNLVTKETSVISKKSTKDNSNDKISDVDVAKSHEKLTSNDEKKLKKLDSTSKSVVVSDSKKSDDKEEKSTSPKIAERAKKKNNNDNEVNFDPQPGCSKSPDKIIHDKRPCLVVKDKKPISLETEDTFSMFLSLCLQTDRSSDMEIVVAKLKRYYEQMNPAYAASQAFRDTLNEKRDLIMRKGKKVVYHYVQLLKEDMKAKKNVAVKSPVKKIEKVEDDERQRNKKLSDDGNEKQDEANDEDDAEEDRRVRYKIKRIEKAMKECQKWIKKYEEAEIDFDDDNNSNYIKLDRFKERMVQLYTQMCKYTNEHPDAGRAYLRPKHLRVTQIPSVDQAINSFINSKLGLNKYKVSKGKSFVDGLIFPDYVDILECVEKVNKEKDMKMGKRAMENLAEKAFTQMGKYLQQARQNDYWDTFSLNLDNNDDPATSDPDLLEKLARNKTIAEENEKKVFEEFVKRQEEGKIDDKDDSPSEIEDEEDEEDQENEKSDKNDKPNHEVESDEPMSLGEDTEDEESVTGNKNNDLQAVEKTPEIPDADDEKCAVEAAVEVNHDDDLEDIAKNNNLEPRDSKDEKDSTSSSKVPSSPKDSTGKEAVPIEVILDDVETEDANNGSSNQEETLQRPLRIRSFAKPPDSWQCSQEANEDDNNKDNTRNSETLEEEDTEQEISVVSVLLTKQDKIVENLTTNDNKTIVGVSLKNNITNNSDRGVAIKSIRPINSSVNISPSITNTTKNGQKLTYIKLTPFVKRQNQLSPSKLQNNPQNRQIINVTRAPPPPPPPPPPHPPSSSPLSLNNRQVTVRPIQTVTSTVAQSVMPRTYIQRQNQLPLLRLKNGKCFPATVAPRAPNTPRFVTVAATSTPIRPIQLPSGGLSQKVIPLVNTKLIRAQLPPRNLNNFSRGVVTSTPLQRLNNHQQNKVKVTSNLSEMTVLRPNNSKHMTNSSPENSKILQQVSNVVAASNIPVKGLNDANSIRLSGFKQRTNESVGTFQEEKKINMAKNAEATREPRDQNRHNSDDVTKRKNQLL